MNIWQVNAQERGGEGLTRIEGLWEMGRGLPGACRGGCGLCKAEQQREVHDWQAFKLSSGWEALRGETVAGET